MKKILVAIAFFSIITFGVASAAEYQPLVGQIPGLTESTSSGNLGAWLNNVYMFLIGIAGALAIIMIFWAGFEFVVSGDNAGKRSAAKSRIQAALGGLLLALSAYLILNTINPQLVNVRLSFSGVNPPAVVNQSGSGVGVGGTSSSGSSIPWNSSGGTYVDPNFLQHTDPRYQQIFGGGGSTVPYNISYYNNNIYNQANNSYYNPASNYSTSGSGGTYSGDKSEQALRAYFSSNGISINKSACPTSTSTNCTNVAGLGDAAIVGLVFVKQRSGGNVVITGGTESGHKTHGIGKPIVDLRYDFTLDAWIKGNSIRTSTLGNWTVYHHSTGTTFMDEDDHWHVVFQ